MDWTKLHRIKAPTDTVISLAEAKDHLRVFHDDDDALIASLIAAATDFIEGPNGSGIALLKQDWVLTLDGASRVIDIDLTPVTAVASITVDGETVDPATYAVEVHTRPTTISLAASLPGAVKVYFTAGYGADPDAVPELLKQAVKLLVGHYYIHRGDADADVPMAVTTILRRYRRF